MEMKHGEGSLKLEIASSYTSSILHKSVEFVNAKITEPNEDNKFLKTKYNFLTPEKHKEVALNGLSNGFSKSNGVNNGVAQAMGKEKTGDGIPAPKHVIGPSDKVVLEWKKINKVGAGLCNLGNTCFMNSVLQCLTYCPPLMNYLVYDMDHQKRCKLGFCMACELGKHAKRSFEFSSQVIKPSQIAQRLKAVARHFRLGRQEDAHEYLRYVIDHMWKGCVSTYESSHPQVKLDAASKETTVINDIFGGYHRSQVQCLNCKANSDTYDYFMDFMLDIKNVSTLGKALEKFITPEILQQENAYKCSHCMKKVPAKKKFTVHRAPKVATFQFKRFDYNRVFGGKIVKPITYPETLNLRPFMSDKTGPDILYKLFGVLVHLGSTCNSGHYYCYVRNSNNTWYQMDDARVCSASLNQVLSQQAYILFYVQKPDPQERGIRKPCSVPSPQLGLKNGMMSGSESKATSSILKENSGRLIPLEIKPKSTLTNGNMKFEFLGIKKGPDSSSTDTGMSSASSTIRNDLPLKEGEHSNHVKRNCDESSDSESRKKRVKMNEENVTNGKSNHQLSSSMAEVKPWNRGVRDLAFKPANQSAHLANGFNRSPTPGLVNGSKRESEVSLKPTPLSSDLLEKLSKESSLHSYGNKVRSWGGADNSLDDAVKQDRLHANKQDDDDFYNDEFDRGKIKKTKLNMKFEHESKMSNGNPFQKYQNKSQSYKSNYYSNNGSSSHHHNREHWNGHRRGGYRGRNYRQNRGGHHRHRRS